MGSLEELSSPIRSAVESDSMKIVRETLHTFAQGLPGLLKVLDEIAEIHPFVKVAVGAFKVVVELDTKRRDNDKKIAVLFMEMKYMMTALTQLQDVKDEGNVGRDGITIQVRMQDLISQTANDIKECANVCDTYSKKKLLVRILKGPIWDSTLQGFIQLFAKRRDEFDLSISFHVGLGVDNANRKLDVVNAKLDAVLEFFHSDSYNSPERSKVESLIRSKGGAEVVLNDDDALREILGADIGLFRLSDHNRAQADGSKYDLQELKIDLDIEPTHAVRENMKRFEQKFQMQKRSIEDLAEAIHHEGDRVIESITSGPHDKIVDPEEQRIRDGLETIRYEIDAQDAVALIMGSQRIELALFPVLNILLRLDYEIIRLCRTVVIGDKELWDCAVRLHEIFDSVRSRLETLYAMFLRQNLDPDNQFGIFAFGLFRGFCDRQYLRSPQFLRRYWDKKPDYKYNDAEEDNITGVTKSLKYPPLVIDMYELPKDTQLFDNSCASAAVKAILGHWCGFRYNEEYPHSVMYSMRFCPTQSDDHAFEASWTFLGAHIHVTGTCIGEPDGQVLYEFTLKSSDTLVHMVFRGHIEADGTALSGSCTNFRHSSSSSHFIFKRIAPEDMCYRPSPMEFRQDKERRDRRRRYLELQHRSPRSDEEKIELAAIRQSLTATDARCYATLATLRDRATSCDHIGIVCDNCRKEVWGARVICLECITDVNTVDLCDTAACMAASLGVALRQTETLRQPHLPTHQMVKVRAATHRQWDLVKVERAAWAALKRAVAAFEGSTAEERKDTDSISPHMKMSPCPTCVVCSAAVTRPCWYCIVCQSDTFVCSACDAKGGASVGQHRDIHGLVRIQKGPEVLTKHLKTLENEVAARIDATLDALQQRFTERLNKIETMLRAVFFCCIVIIVCEGLSYLKQQW
ncbi:hypothetical protein A0H81_13974 [Grifola frondosa]|uniref:Uncharacterized protein n=1 Tax=Grifola frondosa TaxID=5627 RepID=A0A1C7LPZ9_GRIFR|nr:hypothetical protein A0H81_13974 [Grifola frondosa]